MFDERPPPRRKIPTRTLVLMAVALAATVRFFWVMQHRAPPAPGERPPGGTVIEVHPVGPPGTGRDAGAGAGG